MYMISGYVFDNNESGVAVTDKELLITSAGYYRLSDKLSVNTFRKDGRVDYQVIYVAKSKIQLKTSNVWRTVNEGTMVIYKPGERQEYIYDAKEKPEVYWIHVTGHLVDDILMDYEFYELSEYEIGVSSSYGMLIEHIIQEIQLKEDRYQDSCGYLFRQLLIHMKRGKDTRELGNEVMTKMVRNLELEMQRNFAEETQIQEYATKYNISVSWLIREFKQHRGVTPKAYITDIRVKRAKDLLMNSTLNINEISILVGYETPLYFSRIFKKKVGVSPKEYRKSRKY
ncbi:MAG: AraC family transcriptional regulator [Eubacteriales bacterium]